MTNRPVFRMDLPTVIFGSAIVFWSIVFVVVALPFLTFRPPQSADARPLTEKEEAGRRLYAANGCQYCHSQYLRPQDWTGVASFRTVGRVAQAGDYYYQQTPLLGTERTGPDLSQEGGAHTDEWHVAHFRNPRYTFPKSIMPQFSFYFTGSAQDTPNEDLWNLVAYVQSLGGRAADDRVARHTTLKQKLLDERGRGNEEIIHEWFPTTWRNVRNPLEPTQRSLLHGKVVFLSNCIGCHGLQGDGKGPAARWVNNPSPRNFTDVSAQLMFSDGELYDAILYGIDGTAMPAWGDMLTVNDIWDVTNFIRTIPNGGINREPTSDMMVSPADVKPIELTPQRLMLTPRPQAPGLGGAGAGTPAPVGTSQPAGTPQPVGTPVP